MVVLKVSEGNSGSTTGFTLALFLGLYIYTSLVDSTGERVMPSGRVTFSVGGHQPTPGDFLAELATLPERRLATLIGTANAAQLHRSCFSPSAWMCSPCRPHSLQMYP